MKNAVYVKSAVITIFAVFAAGMTVHGLRASYVGIRKGKPDENYIQSTDCRVCHEEHYTSWSRTHHSRMTQDISPETLQGDFDENNQYEFQGVKSKMERKSGGFYMNLSYPDGRSESFKIERTVGSRRVEQYVAKLNGQYFRLPLAYDLINKRWMSLNGSFFYPDGGDFKQHFTQWDTNCVFCHNVKAQPNFNFSTRQARTEVSELGIACGACHGQGAEHAEMASSPFNRAAWRFSDGIKKIVNPLEVDSDRAMMICGHCHGQRVPYPDDRIREVLAVGDPYNAGDDLSKYYRPVHADTKIGEFSFASRFWADGSPRLTAYEYQGILASPCFTKGKPGERMNCMTCHTMHGGDVKGQITDEMRTNVACTQCHTEYRGSEQVARHTMHLPNSAGSSCYSCHMPEVVYGVQAFHKTHQISVPQPSLTIEKGVPNACSQCHVDRSANWAIEQAKLFWPKRYGDLAASPDMQFDIPEGARGLFAGDALTRAMMAEALLRRAGPAWSLPLLAESFDSDNYPIVRFFAANNLAASGLQTSKPDYLADENTRRLQIRLWIEKMDASRMDESRRLAAQLRKLRKDVDLEVGE
ncbi:MAG TPA: cytochrome c3 family protein [Pyrinomonadaceae bacterium]|nr:cytochrome c3 family protein [Pyrinomonadaceae bacterium]